MELLQQTPDTHGIHLRLRNYEHMIAYVAVSTDVYVYALHKSVWLHAYIILHRFICITILLKMYTCSSYKSTCHGGSHARPVLECGEVGCSGLRMRYGSRTCASLLSAVVAGEVLIKCNMHTECNTLCLLPTRYLGLGSAMIEFIAPRTGSCQAQTLGLIFALEEMQRPFHYRIRWDIVAKPIESLVMLISQQALVRTNQISIPWLRLARLCASTL